jgi:hypothetical protein
MLIVLFFQQLYFAEDYSVPNFGEADIEAFRIYIMLNLSSVEHEAVITLMRGEV